MFADNAIRRGTACSVCGKRHPYGWHVGALAPCVLVKCDWEGAETNMNCAKSMLDGESVAANLTHKGIVNAQNWITC